MSDLLHKAARPGGFIQADAKFNASYLRALWRSKSAVPLMALFRRANDPPKEWTESYAAFHHLEPWLQPARLVLHVGDGSHCRTAALFAFHTRHDNVSIDPDARPEVMRAWQDEIGFTVQRMRWFKAPAERDLLRGIGKPGMLLTFVHAHVNTEEVLASLPVGSWDAAFTLACCFPRKQLVKPRSAVARIIREGVDNRVLSPDRRFQVLVPLNRAEPCNLSN